MSCFFTFSVIKLYHGDTRDETSKVMYFLCALCYLGAMLASNKALQYINYPTQVMSHLILYADSLTVLIFYLEFCSVQVSMVSTCYIIVVTSLIKKWQPVITKNCTRTTCSHLWQISLNTNGLHSLSSQILSEDISEVSQDEHEGYI